MAEKKEATTPEVKPIEAKPVTALTIPNGCEITEKLKKNHIVVGDKQYPREEIKLAFMESPKWNGPRELTNIPKNDASGRHLRVLLANTPSVRARDLGDRVFRLKYWFASLERNPFAKENEPEEAVKLVLISDTNETLVTGSGAIKRIMDAIRSGYGDGPYNPVVVLKFTLVKVPSSGRDTFRVEDVTPIEEGSNVDLSSLQDLK